MSASYKTCAGYCGHSEEQSRVSSLDITETGSKEGARALLSDMDWLVSGDRENFLREFIGWHLKDWQKNGPEEKVEMGLEDKACHVEDWNNTFPNPQVG